MNIKKNTLLIIVIIILAGTLSFAFGYMYISAPKAANNTSNVTTINQTMQNSTAIPYSSEYISFNKAKSIAKSKAAKGVTVSDPVLMKNQEGQAIYICSYYYNGEVVGGIILNAKTGAVLYRELILPSNITTTTTSADQYNQNYNDNSNYNNDNYDDSNDNYNDNYDDSNNNDYNDNYDDYDNGYDSNDNSYNDDSDDGYY